MSTALSVNLNKIALIRNSRGHDFPNLVEFAKKCLIHGAAGITIHPRPDQRHATYVDVKSLCELKSEYPNAEINIEGYPAGQFMETVLECKPDQCTLVPDDPSQLTSDHGWERTSGSDRRTTRPRTGWPSRYKWRASLRISVEFHPRRYLDARYRKGHGV